MYNRLSTPNAYQGSHHATPVTTDPLMVAVMPGAFSRFCSESPGAPPPHLLGHLAVHFKFIKIFRIHKV